ncbi:hypothetical protein [Lacticaseibacillus sp. GG6-2]
MSKPVLALIQRTVQASILAFLFWVGMAAMGWRWLIFLVIPTLIYALACLLYALFLWHNTH